MICDVGDAATTGVFLRSHAGLLRCEQSCPDGEVTAAARPQISDGPDAELDADAREVDEAEGDGGSWDVRESVVETPAESIDTASQRCPGRWEVDDSTIGGEV